MAEYVYNYSYDIGKISKFKVTITTSRDTAVLYENDKITLNFSYTWDDTDANATNTSTTYIPKCFHFVIAPAGCASSNIPNCILLDFGNINFGTFQKNTTHTIGPITKTFSLPPNEFRNFLQSNPTSTATIKACQQAGNIYIDQLPIPFCLYYEYDRGDYNSTLRHGTVTKYKPIYYGNLGISIGGEVERCDAEGNSFEQGEYLHWTSFYFETLNTTSDNITPPSRYLSTNSSDITLQYGIVQSNGQMKWTKLSTPQKLISLISENPTRTLPYEEKGKSLIFLDALPDTLGEVTIQIIYKSTLGGGTFTGSFSIDKARAKLHIAGASTGGVAIGKFSTATENNPTFEVADTHTSYFEGPVYFKNKVYLYNNINGNTYEQGEVDTGKKWIDGKIIYRNILVGYSAGNSNMTVASFPSKVDSLISLTGSVTNITENQIYGVHHVSRGNDNYNLAVYLSPVTNTNSTEVHVTAGSSLTGSLYYIIILEYTKA